MARFLGVEESKLRDRLLKINFSENHKNHINTFHGSVIYGLAEISAGVFLAENFQDESEKTFPVLRKSTVKYSAICNGQLHSRVKIMYEEKSCILERLYKNSKVGFTLQTDIFDENDIIVFKGQFEWFVTLEAEYLKISKTEASIEK